MRISLKYAQQFGKIKYQKYKKKDEVKKRNEPVKVLIIYQKSAVRQ